VDVRILAHMVEDHYQHLGFVDEVMADRRTRDVQDCGGAAMEGHLRMLGVHVHDHHRHKGLRMEHGVVVEVREDRIHLHNISDVEEEGNRPLEGHEVHHEESEDILCRNTLEEVGSFCGIPRALGCSHDEEDDHNLPRTRQEDLVDNHHCDHRHHDRDQGSEIDDGRGKMFARLVDQQCS